MKLRLFALIGTALFLTGCSTAEGLRAKALLEQAEQAHAALTSSTFEGSVSFSFQGEQVSMLLSGATSKEGEWVSMSAKGMPGAGDMSMEMIVRGGRAWTNLGGSWESAPAPTGAGPGSTMSAAAFQQLARYVKDVRVTEHQIVGGKAVTTIGGDIDTKGMFEAITKLGPLAGADGFDLSKLGVELGDIHVVLTIDERTRLLDSAYITLAIEAEGEKVELDFRYRLTSANEPVTLPSPQG
ncbi:MAG: hypothetical protein M3R12_10150 [Actinomycetota bacterium]|nr:hypothetical protein [Actinomycetota bacterium]